MKKPNFDVTNMEHRKAFADFISNGNKWGKEGCPFSYKFPFESVVQQAYVEVSKYFLSLENSNKFIGVVND